MYVATVTISTMAYLTIMLINLETPMWLLLNGRKSEAIEILNRIAKFNGVDYRVPENTTFIEVEQ